MEGQSFAYEYKVLRNFMKWKKTTNISVSNSSCLVQDSNPGSLEYEPGVPTFAPRRSIIQRLYTEAFWSPVWWHRAIIR